MADAILPVPSIQVGPEVTGPNYSYTNAIPLPREIGVNDGDSIDSVKSALKGVAYYVDVVGFGSSSVQMTQGMDLKPIGVRFWMKTGYKCSNGATMWEYVNGIPDGKAFGDDMAKRLADGGYPAVRGLAPGILEDVRAAFDPVPVMDSIFGSGFPSCKLVRKEVGDQDGNVATVDASGNKYVYIDNNAEVIYEGGKAYQEHWTLDQYVPQSVYTLTPKVFCPDASLNTGMCDVETFRGSEIPRTPRWKQGVLAAVAVAGLVTLYFAARKRR